MGDNQCTPAQTYNETVCQEILESVTAPSKEAAKPNNIFPYKYLQWQTEVPTDGQRGWQRHLGEFSRASLR